MANLVKSYTTPISQAAGSPPTCFGLPGSQGGNAAWMNVDLTLTAAVYDDYSVAIKVTGTISKSGLLASDYPSVLVANANNWAWGYSGGSIVIPSSAGTLASETIVVANEGSGRGTYTWTLNTGLVPVGKLQDFGGSASGVDGVVWVSGTGTYSVNDPIYPTPVAITIPGFLSGVFFTIFTVTTSTGTFCPPAVSA